MEKSEQEVSDWLISWFKEKTNLDENFIKNNLQENYLIKGWIDSFQFMEFVAEIEGRFKVQFSNDEFQDRGFATISGLAIKISQKMGEKEHGTKQ